MADRPLVAAVAASGGNVVTPRATCAAATEDTHAPGAYLTLPFTWTPAKRFGHGQTSEHRLALPGGQIAILRVVADRGWEMTICDGAGRESPRGLFATPHDALMVLVAEFPG